MKIRTKRSKQAGAITLVTTLLASLGLVNTSQAAGLLIADGGFGGVLEIIEHEAKVTINNGIAVTRVTQVFKNTENRQVEALYTFPVPKGASVANFSMWIGGKEMTGEVLEKERAREIYNSYKAKRRDPGLLEQVDYKTFEMRIFPIAANAEQKVEVTYYQELQTDHDRATYVYPLATVTRKGIDQRVQGKFAINVDLYSAIPINEASSPSHKDNFAIVNHNENYSQASLETPEGSLARDVVLSFEMKRPRTGVDLVASKTRGEDGYFFMSLTAGEDMEKLDTGMDYVFVLDVSGSMAQDGKLMISQDAIQAFVESLDDKDRFEVMTFSVSATTAFNELRSVSEVNQVEARRFLGSQPAKGGTNLKPAIDAAYRYADADRPLNVVILSDGMTDQRERSALLAGIQNRPASSRVFCIGVGNEVNRPLLEQLAEDSGGLAAFLSRGDDFERQAAAFRRKLLRPAITDLTLDFQGVEVYDLIPEKLPNLYHGLPVRVYGRYKGEGTVNVKLKGTVQGLPLTTSAAMEFPAVERDNPEVERMWAWHRIDALQKDINRNGKNQRDVDEIIRLGETFSIVSEYTSFLVLENDAEYKRWKIERRNKLRTARDRTAQAKVRRELDALREKASADIGPAAVDRTVVNAKPAVRQAQPGTQPQVNSPQRRNSNSVDLDFGTGPVGPLFVIVAGWLARRRKN